VGERLGEGVAFRICGSQCRAGSREFALAPVARFGRLGAALFGGCKRGFRFAKCHGGFRVDGNYRMNTYQDVMRDVRPGDAASRLVVLTQPGGSMYRYWSGNRQAKSQLVFQWVVANKALQSR
jgi:hypothetical protein